MHSSSQKEKNLKYGAIIILLIFVVIFQSKYDHLAPPFTTRTPVAKRLLFPDKLLPYIDFGFTNILADYYWLNAVQDLIAWDGKEPFYLNYFKNIASLDPKFEYPYLFSILAVPQSQKLEKDVTVLDKVAAVAQKGIDSIPSGWQIPFYLGTQYYIFTKAYEPAEKYLGIAASRKGAPEGVYLVYSTFVGKNVVRTKNLITNPEQAFNTTQALVKVIYNNTDNQTTKKLLEKGIQVENVSKMLEKGIIAYKERYNKYPTTTEDMIAEHLIVVPEEFLNNFIIRINKNDGSFKILERD